MAGFAFEATVSRWVDADTVLVDPSIYPQDTYLRIRLKDAWEPEIGEEGHDAALSRAEAAFPVGIRVLLTNERVRWTYWRLEARVDKATQRRQTYAERLGQAPACRHAPEPL